MQQAADEDDVVTALSGADQCNRVRVDSARQDSDRVPIDAGSGHAGGRLFSWDDEAIGEGYDEAFEACRHLAEASQIGPPVRLTPPLVPRNDQGNTPQTRDDFQRQQLKVRHVVRVDDVGLDGDKSCARKREHQRLDQRTTLAGIHTPIAADGVQ